MLELEYIWWSVVVACLLFLFRPAVYLNEAERWVCDTVHKLHQEGCPRVTPEMLLKKAGEGEKAELARVITGIGVLRSMGVLQVHMEMAERRNTPTSEGVPRKVVTYYTLAKPMPSWWQRVSRRCLHLLLG